MGTKMERGIQAELSRALMLLAIEGCKREMSVHNLYLRKLTGAQGWGRWTGGKQAGIRRAVWRLTSVPGCDGSGGVVSGEIAGGGVNRQGLLEGRGLLQDCCGVTSAGVMKATTGTKKERAGAVKETPACRRSALVRHGLLRWSPHPSQSKPRDLVNPQEMLNPLKEPRAGWKRDF